MQELASEINGVVIERVLSYACIPVESKFLRRIEVWWFNEPSFTGFVIIPLKASTLAHGINPIRIIRIRHRIKAITPADIVPIIISDASIGPGISRTHPTSIVLQATHNIIRNSIIDIDMIELPYRQIFIEVP